MTYDGIVAATAFFSFLILFLPISKTSTEIFKVHARMYFLLFHMLVGGFLGSILILALSSWMLR